jgi:hypothetical protein
MKIITLTSHADGKLLYINVDTIGHVYDVDKKDLGKKEIYTVVGTTCHNNGGFKVNENTKTILKMISEDKFNVLEKAK